MMGKLQLWYNLPARTAHLRLQVSPQWCSTNDYNVYVATELVADLGRMKFVYLNKFMNTCPNNYVGIEEYSLRTWDS